MNNQDGGGDNVYIEHVYAALVDVDAIWTMVIPELEMTQRSDVVRFVLDTAFTHCETVLEHPDMQMNLYVRNVVDIPWEISQAMTLRFTFKT